MQIEKTENLNSSTNISNNNFTFERTQQKYQSTKEIKNQNQFQVNHQYSTKGCDETYTEA